MASTQTDQRFPQNHQAHGGFTLVELLVVIGIIALLVGLLLPSLNVARQAAQRTVCASRLEQIMLAAQIHLNDHQGYYPIAGYLNGTNGLLTPASLNDQYSTHYVYFGWSGFAVGKSPDTRLICPVTFGLATEMSYARILTAGTDPLQATAETDYFGFIKHFLCPSQASSVADLPQTPMLYFGLQSAGYYIWYTEAQSYIFNEGVLGYDDSMGRLRGRASQVRRSSQSMFAADGLGGSIYAPRGGYATGVGMLTVYNKVSLAPVTLADAYLGNAIAGDPESFDRIRHRGRINVAFCDGHVETRTISAKDLSTIYLLAP